VQNSQAEIKARAQNATLFLGSRHKRQFDWLAHIFVPFLRPHRYCHRVAMDFSGHFEDLAFNKANSTPSFELVPEDYFTVGLPFDPSNPNGKFPRVLHHSHPVLFCEHCRCALEVTCDPPDCVVLPHSSVCWCDLVFFFGRAMLRPFRGRE